MYLDAVECAAGAALSQSQKIAGSIQHNDPKRRPLMESYWASADPECDDGPSSDSFSDHIGRARSVLLKFYGGTGTMTVFGHGQFMQVVRWVIIDLQDRIDLVTIRIAFQDFGNVRPILLSYAGPVKEQGDGFVSPD